MLNIYIKYNIIGSYKRGGYLRALLCAVFVSWFLLSAGVAGAQVQDCTANRHPIYSAWNFPGTVCAGQVVPFSVGYDASNTMVLTPDEPEQPDTLYIPGGYDTDILDSCYFRSFINFPESYTAHIDSVNAIEYIRLKIEHQYADELFIKIVCPKAPLLQLTLDSSLVSSTPATQNGMG